MTFYISKAGQAEIIRSFQKDDQYIVQIHSEVAELFRCYSNRLWIKYDNILKIGVHIFYYSFHALSGIQTTGEEYTGIIQIDHSFSSLPNCLVQVLCFCLEYGGEFALRQFLLKYRKAIEGNSKLTTEAKRLFIIVIDIVLDFIPIFHAIHRGLFYLDGQKYNISRRLVGINYVLVRHWLKQNHSVFGYKILGYITLAQAILSSTFYVKRKLKSINEHYSKLHQLLEAKSMTNKVCILCMDVRTNATVLPCGHIFCWDCVLGWLDQKHECPICRQTTEISQAVFLINYQRT